jgi:hypothetical protein
LFRLKGKGTEVLRDEQEQINAIHSMKRIVIYRHPECEKCARMARWHRLFDWFNHVAVVTTTPPTGPLQMGEIIVKDLPTGRFLTGVEGLKLICRQIPSYWLFLPLLWIPAVRARADREACGCTNGSCQIGNFSRNPNVVTRS